MGNHLKKAQKKLAQRQYSFDRIKNMSTSKKGNSAYKRPGSMNAHKQLGNKG